MPIGIKTTTPVNITAATATINADIEDTTSYHCHRFFFTIGTAATIMVQGSHDGVTFFDLLAADVTADGEIRELDRPWSHVRVKVTGNNGNTVVTLQQLYSNSAGTV